MQSRHQHNHKQIPGYSWPMNDSIRRRIQEVIDLIANYSPEREDGFRISRWKDRVDVHMRATTTGCICSEESS